ncbi:MAG: four helix bundle protein [Flavisolibacter sp.]
MSTITKFEDLHIWQLARLQVTDFNKLREVTSLGNDFPLRNQMNSSSGSVMDCIAEGFDRSGNAEFKHFLLIAKGSNAEYRSQLYRCLDRKHLNNHEFNELFRKNVILGNKIMAMISYLQKANFKGQRFKSNESST